MKTTLDNKLIAEFMGYEIYPDGYCDNSQGKDVEHLPMFNDWNELMPVIEKILSDPNTAYICQGKEWDMHYSNIHDSLWSLNIEATYNAVVKFIKWYNENK